MIWLSLFGLIVIIVCVKRFRKRLKKKTKIPIRDDYADSDDEIPSYHKPPHKFSDAWIAQNAPRKAIYRSPYGARESDEEK